MFWLFGILPFVIARPDGSLISGYHSEPAQERYPVLTLLQGAELESVSILHQELEEMLLPFGIGICSIEKRGITPERIDRTLYDTYNRPTLRLLDYHTLLAHFDRGLFPGWDRRMVLLGGSEGSVLASILAADPGYSFAGVALLARGGGMHPMDATMLAFRKWFEQKHMPEFARTRILNSIRLRLEGMIANPQISDFFYGHNSIWWAEHLTHPEWNEALFQIRCPIFYVHGTEDEVIPVEAADIFVEAASLHKLPLTYTRLDGAGHRPHQSPSFAEAALPWLLDVLTER